MTFRFGRHSVEKLVSCDERLVRVAHRTLLLSPFDVSVLKGHRSRDEQMAAFCAQQSKLKWPQSKHNVQPSHALDLAPFPVDWTNVMQFTALAGIVFAAAGLEGVNLRWGGDWNGDWSGTDQSFHDLPHYELKE